MAHRSATEVYVDMNSLVWPPRLGQQQPQTSAGRSRSTPSTPHTRRSQRERDTLQAQRSPSYQSSTLPSRHLPRSFYLSENGPADSSIAQRRFGGMSTEYSSKHAIPVNQPDFQSPPISDSTTSTTKYGIKEFPPRYNPTPVPRPIFSTTHNRSATANNPLPPAPRPVLSSNHDSSRSQTPSHSMSFFEPLVDLTSEVRSPYVGAGAGKEFLSPVIDPTGRRIDYCLMPDELEPGGVVEKGWPEDFVRSPRMARSFSGNSNSHSHSHSHHANDYSQGRSGTQSRASGSRPRSRNRATPHTGSASPLHYQYDAAEYTHYQHPHHPVPVPFPPPVEELTASPESSLDSSGSDESAESPDLQERHPVRPTRRGYWNRRGDTILPTGRIQPAPPGMEYPDDLKHYPKYALMNEIGQLTLGTEEDRVTSWLHAE